MWAQVLWEAQLVRKLERVLELLEQWLNCRVFATVLCGPRHETELARQSEVLLDVVKKPLQRHGVFDKPQRLDEQLVLHL